MSPDVDVQPEGDLEWDLSTRPAYYLYMIFKKKARPVAPIVHTDDDDFERVIGRHKGITVVDFWSPSCSPCRMMEPILDEIAIEYEPDGVLLLKVNVDEATQTAAVFDIRSIPTLMFFRDGEPLFQMVGAVPKPVLEREIKGLLAENGPAR